MGQERIRIVNNGIESTIDGIQTNIVLDGNHHKPYI